MECLSFGSQKGSSATVWSVRGGWGCQSGRVVPVLSPAAHHKLPEPIASGWGFTSRMRIICPSLWGTPSRFSASEQPAWISRGLRPMGVPGSGGRWPPHENEGCEAPRNEQMFHICCSCLWFVIAISLPCSVRYLNNRNVGTCRWRWMNTYEFHWIPMLWVGGHPFIINYFDVQKGSRDFDTHIHHVSTYPLSLQLRTLIYRHQWQLTLE